ncbi:MAG: dTDP-4-dehydrorhamnose reductase [Nakamurella sp.]
MPSLLVTGAHGQLGTDLRTVAAERGVTVAAFGSGELDITDPVEVDSTLAAFAHDHPGGVVVNAAAYTAVDNAETDTDAAYAVNATGPGLLAAAAAEHGLGLIHVSTDYVFPGDATTPYEPTDPTGPNSVYGASKLAGEQAVLAAHPGAHVVRTAWVYGATGGNFVKTMCALEKKLPTIAVVDDQTGSPTWSYDLAAGLIELAGSDVPGGVLHGTNAGETTWFEFTKAIYLEIGADPDRVTPTTTDKFPRPAPRPAYSVLSPTAWNAAGLTPLRPWREALAAAFGGHRDAFVPAAPG